MTELVRVFENCDFGNIRVMVVDEKELFVVSDVAKALGYLNTSKAISDHCRSVTKRYTRKYFRTLEVGSNLS